MDIMERIRSMPQEVQDAIFPYVLLPETSPSHELSLRDERQRYYTMPLPRAKVTLSSLVSLMTQILKGNEYHGLNWAQATLCIVRLFQIYDLFKLIPDEFFHPHLGRYFGHLRCCRWRPLNCGILEASGFVRLKMLARECSRARGDDPLSQVFNISHKHMKHNLVQHSEQMFAEDIPTFLLHTVNITTFDDGFDDLDCFIEMSDSKIQAHYVDTWGETTHWLKREAGPWMFTIDFAKIKYYDEKGRGGVEWSFGSDNYKIEFDFYNVRSTSIGRYLCSFDEAGYLRACQAHYDAGLAREEEKERLRSTMVAAMSKKERAERIDRQGRFWCLA